MAFWAFTTNAQTYGQRMVAAVVTAEAGGEGYTGMLAVTEVIRTRADKAGVSMLVAVQRSKAFSVLNGNSLENLYWAQSSKNVYTQALAVVRMAYNMPQALPGVAKGANHFCRTNAHPAWAEGQTPVVIIGHHAFFRL